MRAIFTGLTMMSMVVCAGVASAYDANDPNNCNGVDWDDKQAIVVSQVTARPRVNFIKSPYDDNFTADACPTASAACRKKSYLVTRDIVLAGRTRSAFTCVDYQSPSAKHQEWTVGWLPSAALTPLPPMQSPKASDWMGSWVHPGGHLDIVLAGDGKLKVDGDQAVPTAHDFHTGVVHATAMPRGGVIAFVDDGSVPFDTPDQGECRVRMQRVGPWLVVEDNSGCGGAGVTFTGLYHRKN